MPDHEILAPDMLSNGSRTVQSNAAAGFEAAHQVGEGSRSKLYQPVQMAGHQYPGQ
jgi:hypothetical protein